MTHVGRVRSHNEDAVFADDAAGLWAIADGMGGHGHGDVASGYVVEYLGRLARMRSAGVAGGDVEQALHQANAAIQDRALRSGWHAIGATAVVLAADAEPYWVVWAGDSRAYRWRGGALQRLTRDHSLVEEMIESGAIEADAARHPQAHVVTRAIGVEPEVELERTGGRLAAGDLFLLCSDGLSGCVSDAEIARILQAGGRPRELAETLTEAALADGAPDNVSVVVVLVCAEE
ncbi:MAG TPA: protein phosphatase 2C domain-containing protein [Thermohalobaculum sp.]|nr:protein phosphatase 2C domain-containing protein [Thermohalobaculum sp.]